MTIESRGDSGVGTAATLGERQVRCNVAAWYGASPCAGQLVAVRASGAMPPATKTR